MDLISSNLQGTNAKYNSILSKLESTKSTAFSNLETAAATATSAISAELSNVTSELRTLVPEGFSVPNVNLQGQLQSLSGLVDPAQSANLLASITSDFGDALSASGFSLDTLVSDAASAFGLGDTLSGVVPNFERSPLGDVIQKANAVKVPSIDPVIEEASTFTENSDFAAAKTAATNAVFSTSTALPTADAGVYKVSDKSKKISQPSGGVVITKEVTTPDKAVEGDTRKNISSKGFSNRVVTHGDTFLEGPGSGRLGPPSFGYWSTSGDDLIITLNYEPTQILGIQGVVDDSQAEQHFDAASGVTKKVTRFIIGKSTVKGFETSVYQKDDFELVEGSNGKTIRIKQKYRIYNVNIKVYYKYNDTYDANYAKA